MVEDKAASNTICTLSKSPTVVFLAFGRVGGEGGGH
jgi:hypothetical protein